jgi:sarcosine oxidase
VSEEHRDVVVIGGGAMGSAAAWQLARRGRDVLLLEQFGPGHTHGASHGSRRNFNLAYSEPEYVAMLVESARLWRELEAESGAALLELTGLVDHGPDPRSEAVQAALTAAGVRASVLRLEDAAERWPGIRFDTRVLYLPDAGTLRADESVVAMQGLAGEVRHGTRVVGLEVRDDDDVALEVESSGERSRLRANRVIVTAGAWTTGLLAGLVPLPRLTVTHEQPAHFAVREPATAWPSFNHRRGDGAAYDFWPAPIYGLFDPLEGVKVGWHGGGPEMHPDLERPLDAVRRANLQRYVREWLPGADPDDFAEISCTYTSTDSTDFVLDRVGPIVIGAGFSGHGFKFVPAVGLMLADLTGGIQQPERFRAGRAPA